MEYEFNNSFTKELKELSDKYLKELEKIDDTPKIIRNYKFINHPIRWIKDRKKIKILNLYNKIYWNNNKGLINKSLEDMALYGTSIINIKDIK